MRDSEMYLYPTNHVEFPRYYRSAICVGMSAVDGLRAHGTGSQERSARCQRNVPVPRQVIESTGMVRGQTQNPRADRYCHHQRVSLFLALWIVSMSDFFPAATSSFKPQMPIPS
jgi:hypothetical protein